MDELKKDEILEEAEEPAAEELAAPEIASEDVETITEKEVTELKSELETELEELRDMFQKELDAQTNGTEGLVVPQSDDEAVDAEEEEEFIPCDCCGGLGRRLQSFLFGKLCSFAFGAATADFSAVIGAPRFPVYLISLVLPPRFPSILKTKE